MFPWPALLPDPISPAARRLQSCWPNWRKRVLRAAPSCLSAFPSLMSALPMVGWTARRCTRLPPPARRSATMRRRRCSSLALRPASPPDRISRSSGQSRISTFTRPASNRWDLVQTRSSMRTARATALCSPWPRMLCAMVRWLAWWPRSNPPTRLQREGCSWPLPTAGRRCCFTAATVRGTAAP
ncbi:hypothetical protein BV98_003798 [Sphingobium herbicidovorans NBRC 16415]|uniref:Uncharacterized protein n=1 Tax=Sphingobium herbicidovorans (strain ATCC 700291 / DSM 11019 / CCUG 56400 / KCTC 2939 / LMG 18315 / NBRC 16415 / MH) TaxID=1219045 RepID=A0A086P4T0_SPHHM|nr:hypothetical protein BV98_003798 [Sphingobium herbicidovorans NBRC 16415]